MATAKKKQAPKKTAAPASETIDVLNVNHPGKTEKRNRAKYEAARKAFLGFMPKGGPGLTQADMMAAMRKALPVKDFPGSTSSWWMKTVQLDAEARGEVTRDGGKPLRWKRAR